ncbi:DUF1836 domain-containing protein [Anaerovorax odorimutans]|uniref:DUF1836 domain-containing protein n=1 Tax=Anaerovorax odorimutans TaxID=109327 RepID=A0ABT1RRM5_9FIRM|nr:DUF1836 domain-containing protein [Anaerovorax odorimutans]MCQ4637827.1 DUF1836 domain-containing protein [Anaerovorax odorimutans]
METIKKILEEKRPNKWEDIPDIDLYMDQVLNYMPRQHAGLELDENLTAAMVNNYIKKGLLPRAVGKKYNRTHIAYLTAICLLKQVLSVNDTGELLKAKIQDQEIRDFYESYMEVMDEEFKKVSAELQETEDKADLSEMALRLAISSYAQKLACEQMLKALEETDGQEKE